MAGRTVEYAGNAADTAAAAATVFAIVPAVSDTLDTTVLTQATAPFVGSASTTAWDGNRYGFGFVGAQAALQTKVVSPAWGAGLRSLLGTAQGSTVTSRSTTASSARRVRPRPARRCAPRGSALAPPSGFPRRPRRRRTSRRSRPRSSPVPPAVVMLLTSPATTGGIAQLLAQVGFTGTVATDASMYQPTTPAAASGLTVLVPYAPFEQPTAANRRLAADVEAFAPGTQLTPGIAAGYWSADLFLRMLGKTGKRLTRERFLAVARRFCVRGAVHHRRTALAGGALPGRAVRRAGAERRLPVRRGRALHVRHADRGEDPEALDDHHHQLRASGRSELCPSGRLDEVTLRRRGGNRPSS